MVRHVPWSPARRRRPRRLSHAAAVTPSGRGGKCRRRAIAALRGGSWAPLEVPRRRFRAGTPRTESRALHTAPRALPLPLPRFPPGESPSTGRSYSAAVPGRAGRRRWAVTPRSFTLAPAGCDGTVPGGVAPGGRGGGGGQRVRRGPALRMDFHFRGVTRPTPSSPLHPPPQFHCKSLPSCRVAAAWASGGATCEAAGRGDAVGPPELFLRSAAAPPLNPLIPHQLPPQHRTAPLSS